MNGAAVSHDANGNLTGYAGATYSWDVRGRLRTLAKPGFNYTFGYNQADLRTSKAVNGATTSFLLDGDSIVSETAGGVTKHLLQSPQIDQPLQRDGKWFVPANLGSTAALTDGAGVTVQTYGYKPFGELTNAPSDPNPFQFTGRENDGTGLMYYRARYYAPEWGRFISEDPIGFEGGINQYAYVDNNPLNRADPSGLFAPALAPVLVPLAPILIPVSVAAGVAAGVVIVVTYADDVWNRARELFNRRPTPTHRDPGRGHNPPTERNPKRNDQGLPQPDPKRPEGFDWYPKPYFPDIGSPVQPFPPRIGPVDPL